MTFPFRKPRKGQAIILKEIVEPWGESDDGMPERKWLMPGDEVEVVVDDAGRAHFYVDCGERVAFFAGDFRWLSPLELLARCAP